MREGAGAAEPYHTEVDSPDSIDEMIAAIDWYAHPLGPRERWPAALQTALNICRGASIPIMVFWGPQFIQLYNMAAIAFLGARHPAAFGQPAQACWPDKWEHLGPLLTAVRMRACAMVDENQRFVREDVAPPTESFYRIAYSPIPDGRAISGVFAIAMEITAAVMREREDRERAQERSFLSEASRLLSESLDLRATLQQIAQLTIPAYADWCRIDLVTSSGRIKTFGIAHRDPRKHFIAQQFAGRYRPNPDAQAGNPHVIRTGASDLLEETSPAELRVSLDEGEAEVYELLGTRSVASVPLVAQGRTLGAIGAAFGDSGRRYSKRDLRVLEELGRRAGPAIQNAREFWREQRVAQSFQEASLPAELPEVFGIRFDAVYVPADDDAQIGGDWYDAMRLFDGRIVVSIGDVAGKGLRAAVTMGNMRQIIRGIAQVHADPALMLDAADRALRLERPDQFVTAFVGVVDPITKTLAYASAGHPPPLMRFGDGRIEALSDGGLPLGLRSGRECSGGRVLDVSDAQILLLYTDGLTELFKRPVEGELRLRALLGHLDLFAGEHPARAVKDAFFAGRVAHDDVALLVVGFGGAFGRDAAPTSLRQWTFDAKNAQAVQTARHEIGELLRGRGGAFEDVYAAEMVFGELVGNIVRYAPGPVEVTLDWSGLAPVLHVLDRGPGFAHTPILPADLFSESGRGLFLVSTLTQDFHVSRRPNGGSHARAVLALRRERLGQPLALSPP